ncbi:hypothetical protein [Daejeonella lutea]|uniref:Uncharacterized protein n=1 Tax=Daejeonella lutea TaxID=572036 RepID=A0A1T5A4E6_9SPHI|nr:hypothetical protein [Daejeonella lutea]SKB29587.1 hypothetical protein SAMN05661099_0284 [Daejeonella lutea]
MKYIQAYSDTSEALIALDNGGRFYNILTNAEDGKISAAELAKVGGLFNDRQKMILFLELSISKLDAADRAKVLTSLDEALMESFHKFRAQKLLPSQAQEKGILSHNAIITGIPKMTESRKDFKGFILIPIMTGKVMTFVPVPIIEKYDIYEVRDEMSATTFLIAHTKGEAKLPEEKIVVAGVLKELKTEKDEDKGSRKFLEVNYFMSI